MLTPYSLFPWPSHSGNNIIYLYIKSKDVYNGKNATEYSYTIHCLKTVWTNTNL